MERNVPKLRFKGFNDEWKEKKLSEIANIVGGGTPSTTEKSYWDGNIQWFTPTEIKDAKYVASSMRTITEQGVKNSSAKILPKGSILLTTRATLGEMAILENDATTNQGFQSLIVNKNNNNEFVYYLQEKIKKYCYKNASGSTFLEISKSNLEKFKVNMPSLQEQERIANFLTKVDKIIEKQEEKVKNLENYKKGMMQKIFSQEIRFKDENGKEYPEWNKEHLGNLVERVVRKNKGNISNRPLTISAKYGLVDQEEFFNKVVASSNLEGYYLLENGEFAYNKSYSNGYPFGAIKRLDKYDDGAVSTLYICFKPKNGLSSDFLCHYFESDMWHKEVAMVAVEGARNHGLLNISVGDFFDTIHKVPCKKEQIQIANFLNNISNLLYKEENKFKELQKWKKALLQQMFV